MGKVFPRLPELTLADWAKRLDPDWLIDPLVKRTALPVVNWRKLNTPPETAVEVANRQRYDRLVQEAFKRLECELPPMFVDMGRYGLSAMRIGPGGINRIDPLSITGLPYGKAKKKDKHPMLTIHRADKSGYFVTRDREPGYSGRIVVAGTLAECTDFVTAEFEAIDREHAAKEAARAEQARVAEAVRVATEQAKSATTPAKLGSDADIG